MSQEAVNTENVAEAPPEPAPPEAPPKAEEPKEPVPEVAVAAAVEEQTTKVEESAEPKEVTKDEDENELGVIKQVTVDESGNVMEEIERVDSKYQDLVERTSVLDENRLLSVDLDEIDSDSETLEELEYLKREKLSTQVDFFTAFAHIPSISAISLSLDIDEDSVRISRAASSEHDAAEQDIGKFVNPLTGEDLQGEVEEEQEEEGSEEPEPEGETSEESSISIDLEIASIISIQEEKKEAALDEDELGVMFELMIEQPAAVGEVDTMMEEREMERLRQLQIRDSTLKFLNRLIDQAMEKADFIDPKEVLRNSLDKDKLLDELYNDLVDLEKERRTHFFLNSKMVEYYRRSKNFGPISPDPVSLIQKRYTAYMDALKQLDFLLEKESETVHMNENILMDERARLSEMEESVKEAEEQLEKTIITTLIKPKASQKWKMYVEKTLQRMAVARNEISEERFKVIRKQHTMAELAEKLNKIENISPNFTMTMYERTMGKVIKLSDNLHDLDQTISKVNDQYHNVLHLLSHIREKRHMMLIQISEAKQKLQAVKDEHNRLRDVLYRDKLKHVQLLADLQDLSYNVGLMDKPLLMYDYDRTVDDIEELTRELNELREQYGIQGRKSKWRPKRSLQ